MATPQFVNQYLFDDRKQFTKDFHYGPWLLATLVVSDLTDNLSFPLCWDNVAHGSKGLGYIYDQHQSLQQIQDKKVITYYYSFSSSDCGKSRQEIYKKLDTWEEYSAHLPEKVEEFDWRSFQQEYRDYIDLAKLAQLIPVIGAAVGGIANYKLINHLSETAKNGYRMRYFRKKMIIG